MPIIAQDSQDWELPSEGIHRAVCCDVVDLGMVDGQWGPKHMAQLRWQLEEQTSEDKPMLTTRRFTLSLNEKALLRPFLETWRGKKFTEAELKGFDLEKLIDVNCQLQIIYNDRDGRTYANVQAIFPAVKGLEPLTVRDYIRIRDRPADPVSPTTPTGTNSQGQVKGTPTEPHQDVPKAQEPMATLQQRQRIGDGAKAVWGLDWEAGLREYLSATFGAASTKDLVAINADLAIAELSDMADKRAEQAALGV